MCSAPKKSTSILGTPRPAVHPRSPVPITMTRLESIFRAAECLCMIRLGTAITGKLGGGSQPRDPGHSSLFIPSTQVACTLSSEYWVSQHPENEILTGHEAK